MCSVLIATENIIATNATQESSMAAKNTSQRLPTKIYVDGATSNLYHVIVGATS